MSVEINKLINFWLNFYPLFLWSLDDLWTGFCGSIGLFRRQTRRCIQSNDFYRIVTFNLKLVDWSFLFFFGGGVLNSGMSGTTRKEVSEQCACSKITWDAFRSQRKIFWCHCYLSNNSFKELHRQCILLLAHISKGLLSSWTNNKREMISDSVFFLILANYETIDINFSSKRQPSRDN
jgi:hypothetical protein